MNGLSFRELLGTLKVCDRRDLVFYIPGQARVSLRSTTHVRQHLPQQLPLLITIPTSVEANETSASLQTVPRHLQLIHRVDVLHVTLDRRTVRRSGKPEVKIFVTTSFKVEGVVARVKVGELVDEMEG